jgi:hypothetical protein
MALTGTVVALKADSVIVVGVVTVRGTPCTDRSPEATTDEQGSGARRQHAEEKDPLSTQ